MRTLLIFCIAVSVAACAAGHPAGLGSTTSTELALLVDRVSEGRAHLVKRFDAPPGLVGVVVEGNERGGRQLIGWATADGRHLLLGNLFNAEAEDLTAQAYAAHIVPPALGDDAFYQQLSQAPAVTQFPAGERTLFIFADADCVYCRLLFQDIAPLEAAFAEASVRVRWVLVGTQSAESGRRGAAILQQGFAGLAFNALHYDDTRHRGGIDGSNDRRLIEQVEANTRLMMQSSAASKATPTLVWRSARGVQVSVGAPTVEGLRAILQDIVPDA